MSNRRKFVAIAGAGSLGEMYAHLVKTRLDKPLAPGCSNEAPVVDFSCNPCFKIPDINRIYLAKAPKTPNHQKPRKLKAKKKRPIKIKGQQYARPFYIHRNNY